MLLNDSSMVPIQEDYYIEPPFPQSAQLCDELEYVSKEFVLRNKNFGKPRLPGQPQIDLSDSSRLLQHCNTDIGTPKFDALVTRKLLSIRLYNEKHKSLSEQGVLKRHIVVTENPGLHCVWEGDRIFIKPIPLYLTSHAFWRFINQPAHAYTPDVSQSSFIASAKGLLRSYSQLITHPSDFEIAKRYLLVPRTWTFESLMLFLENFAMLPDSTVSPKHRIGEMQLQTLNWTSFFRTGGPYFRLHRNRYNAYFHQYYSPTLFLFATFSVILNAMQVALAVRQGQAPIEQNKGLPEAGFGGGLGGSWRRMGAAFGWFSLYSVCFALSLGLVLLVLFFGLITLDTLETWKDRAKKTKDDDGRDRIS